MYMHCKTSDTIVTNQSTTPCISRPKQLLQSSQINLLLKNQSFSAKQSLQSSQINLLTHQPAFSGPTIATIVTNLFTQQKSTFLAKTIETIVTNQSTRLHVPTPSSRLLP